MKRTYLALVILTLSGLTACTDSGKTAEDIEQEYANDQNTTITTDDQNNPNKVVENAETTEENVVDVSQFEYLEDFAKLDTKTKLYNAYGAENLEDDSQWFAEGTVEYQITRLTDPNTLNVYIYNWSQGNNETLSFIEAPTLIWDNNYEVARRQVVMSKSGVFTGMTIKDLHTWNGADFSFSGFGWDYEGGIFAEEGSNIANAGVIIKLSLEDYNNPDNTHLLGDIEFSTADEGILDAPIMVDRITYYPEELAL